MTDVYNDCGLRALAIYGIVNGRLDDIIQFPVWDELYCNDDEILEAVKARRVLLRARQTN